MKTKKQVAKHRMALQNESIAINNNNSRGKKKYCRFKKNGIKYIDYKNPDFLLSFINDQGKILPRRMTGNSQKFQKKVAKAIKKARHLAILPYVSDLLKGK